MTRSAAIHSTVVRHVALVLGGVLVACLLLEIVIRLTSLQGINFYFDLARYHREAALHDEKSYYLHRPHLEYHLSSWWFRTNNLGLRGPDVGVKTRPRVIILGDSVVFAWGVSEGKTYAHPLRMCVGERAEVITAGASSWSTGSELQWLEREGLGLQPDTIILVYVDNDAPFTDAPPPPPLWQKVADHSWLVTYLAWSWRTHSPPADRPVDAPRQYAMDDPGWRRSSDRLRRFSEACRRSGIEFIVVMYRTTPDIASRLWPRLLEFSAVHSVPVCNGSEWFKQLSQREFAVSTVDIHAGTQGQAIMAAKFCEMLSPDTNSPHCPSP